MRSGFIAIPRARAYHIGMYGDYWSASTNSVAYFLHINNASINPNMSDSRDYGLSLRCLSTVLDM